MPRPYIPKKLSTKKLAEAWRDDEHGEFIQINPDGSVVETASGRAHKVILTKQQANDLTHAEVFAAIRDHMQEEGFFPNIWSVNDHGNVTLYDGDGNDLGGLV